MERECWEDFGRIAEGGGAVEMAEATLKALWTQAVRWLLLKKTQQNQQKKKKIEKEKTNKNQKRKESTYEETDDGRAFFGDFAAWNLTKKNREKILSTTKKKKGEN
jgi:hypothetical protein